MDQEDFKEAMDRMAKTFHQETIDKKQEELEEYWFFEWDDNLSVESNIYQFNRQLDLYRSQCRKWETHHNGHCCVVERVRDTYLMPKIKEFKNQLKEKL